MAQRSNMFMNYEVKFMDANEEELTEIAIDAAREVLQNLQAMHGENDQFILMVISILSLGAKLGAYADEHLSVKEKKLVDTVFSEFFGEGYDGELKAGVYDQISNPISDQDYNMVDMTTKLGPDMAIPFLCYVLAFGYIDGPIDDEIANKLDSMYGMVFIQTFMQSGLEEVPTPTRQIRLEGLEAEIANIFEEEDPLYTVDQVCEALGGGKTKASVQKALDSLCDKEYLNCVDTFCGKMYSHS